MPAVAPANNNRGAKRARLLDEAAQALNHRGVSQTSLAEIAQRVGVSRAALYYYFDDQEDLVFQCYRRSCEQMARRLNEASKTASGTLDIVDRFVSGLLSEDEPEFAALSEVAFLRPDQRSTILGLYEGLRASLAHLLEEGIRRGEVRPCRASLVAPAIIGVVSWVPMARRWHTDLDFSNADFVQIIKDLLHYGVAADRATAPNYEPFALISLDLPAGRVFDPEAMAAARQEALLASASWLFNLKGVDATSLEEIALRVGVTKKVIYHNMGDKQTLVAACHRRAFRFYESVVARMRAHDGPRVEAITACMHAFAEASLREDVAPLPLITGHDAVPEEERRELHASVARLMNVHLETYAKGWTEGSVRAINARVAVSMTPGFFEWLPKWFEVLTAEEREAAPGETARLYRLGLEAI